MTKVFFVEDTGEKLFSQTWWCDTCNTIGHRHDLGRGVGDDIPSVPDSTISDVVCDNCHGEVRLLGRGGSTIWKRTDTGEELTHIHKHPGACYADPEGYFDRNGSRQHRFGPDGRALVVICPDGYSWYIDSRASNCTMKDDNDHRCWVRHGSPDDGTLHVDKNGHTCGAGAGSIATAKYHGFLHHGSFTENL